ncbi:RING-H2 finger protein ATL39-like [Phragmites australis]|uniref:RING-H2 finger protein ATL39-like n=1 Tax=Phragmites australis TaxID=29695 RepID=UPI002D79BCEC|nr:RING-H2 finger protein ATL39-like [Phragmites australis]
MSERSSSSYGDADTGTDVAPATATRSISWTPQGRALTACLVAVNVALVALVYLYFWRVFSRKRATSPVGGGDNDDGASSSASTPSSPPRIQDHDRLVASLPTFVVRSGAGEKGAAAECAVCIAELRGGDEGRALPRCGHRFHAACVDAWLQRHATCPLCRASVVAAETEAGPKGGGVTDTTTAAVEDVDARV